MASNQNLGESAAKRPSSPSNKEPPTRRQSISFASSPEKDDSIASQLERASTSAVEFFQADRFSDDIIAKETDCKGQEWLLCCPTSSASSIFWKHFDRFDATKHPQQKDKAACKHCFSARQYKKGIVACKGVSTSGLKRHVEAHHLQEFEDSIKKKPSTAASSGILKHLKATKKGPPVAVEDLKQQFKLAATSWVIDQAVPFDMVTVPSFRNMFHTLNRNSSSIVNIRRRSIREQAMTLGRYAERATELEVLGREISWTTDHWTGPNDETYTTVSGHYIGHDWVLQSAILDFKVFQGSTSGENIDSDIKDVLKRFQGDTVMVLDTIGITDTTGNMGKLGQYCRENGRRHGYCTDHNFHRNAILAFDRKSVSG
jgi:hypothetical protein